MGLTPVSSATIRTKAEALREHLYAVREKVTDAMLTQRRADPSRGKRPVDFDVGDYVLYAMPGKSAKDKTKP
ncbi:hypothetical protein, partial [Silvimonas sp.]|uniref:hypothetical protein n=1 Tax=Silvimonas sp. TaxID=2650811 RepID=UPI00283CBEC7